jgi:Pyrimidine dimer DNA glycosylase
MNIFALDPDPAIAASMHCDQHLHKMILESAQIVSTVLWDRVSPMVRLGLYKPTHINHPCTLWAAKSDANLWWLIQLAHNLNDIRESLGSSEHSSIATINVARYFIEPDITEPVHHIFCGAPELNLRSDLSVHERYQKYYIQKFHQWLDTRQPMSYKGRPLPQFLSPYKDSIQHGNFK